MTKRVIIKVVKNKREHMRSREKEERWALEPVSKFLFYSGFSSFSFHRYSRFLSFFAYEIYYELNTIVYCARFSGLNACIVRFLCHFQCAYDWNRAISLHMIVRFLHWFQQFHNNLPISAATAQKCIVIYKIHVFT